MPVGLPRVPVAGDHVRIPNGKDYIVNYVEFDYENSKPGHKQVAGDFLVPFIRAYATRNLPPRSAYRTEKREVVEP